MLTGHGKTRAYLHRFKARDKAYCVWKLGDQTNDHLLYDCNLLEAQRRILRKKVTMDSGHLTSMNWSQIIWDIL
jgi:hypothetical protein